MKNSEELLNEIKQIPNLDKEIVMKVVKQDLKLARKSDHLKKQLESIIDETIDFNDNKIIEKMVESYMNMTPYTGYCHNYWKAKKDILKEQYNIEWISPEQEGLDAIYD